MAFMKSSPLDREIRARIEAFVADLSTLIRGSVVDALSGALGIEASSSAAPRAVAASAAPAPAPASASATKAKKGNGKRERRSADQVNASAERFLEFVTANPGLRLEQIAAGIGMPTKGLKLPVIKLAEAGAIYTEGQRRGTKYFAGSKKSRPRTKKA